MRIFGRLRPVSNTVQRRPPEAKVSGSNPDGRAIIMKDLRANAGPFLLSVPKWCSASANISELLVISGRTDSSSCQLL